MQRSRAPMGKMNTMKLRPFDVEATSTSIPFKCEFIELGQSILLISNIEIIYSHHFLKFYSSGFSSDCCCGRCVLDRRLVVPTDVLATLNSSVSRWRHAFDRDSVDKPNCPTLVRSLKALAARVRQCLHYLDHGRCQRHSMKNICQIVMMMTRTSPMSVNTMATRNPCQPDNPV